MTAIEGKSTVRVFSAEDGRLLGQPNHPAGEFVRTVMASPTGRRVATITHDREGAYFLRTWDTNSWWEEPPTVHLKVPFSRFLTDDLFVNWSLRQDGWGFRSDRWSVYRPGQAEPVALTTPPYRPAVDGLVHLEDGTVFDLRTLQRLLPPPGRKFHPALARFAPDGRFILTSDLIDTRTEKAFPLPWKERWEDEDQIGPMPVSGVVHTQLKYGAEVRLLPPADRLDIPPDLLELWAQVAVRGELGPDGTFVKWDEPTWERQHQELAAKPAPYPDFPFPGRVATDKLHWLRAEFNAAEADADKLRLAGQLLRRAEEIGDRDEAVRWRDEVARLLHLPLPW